MSLDRFLDRRKEVIFLSLTHPRAVFLTFGDGDFRYRRARDRLLDEAQATGVYTHTFGFNLKALRSFDPELHALAQSWISQGDLKGIGYWSWKSALIYWAAQNFPGYLIHYMDAGHVLRPNSATSTVLQNWLKTAHEARGLCWSLPDHPEEVWTKAETLDLLDKGVTYRKTDQLEGGFVILKSEDAIPYAWELRRFSLIEDGFHLSDKIRTEQIFSFRSHRNDQSVHSLLWKQMNYSHFPTETFPIEKERHVLAARHASGFTFRDNKKTLAQRAEFYLGKVHKASLIYRRSLS